MADVWIAHQRGDHGFSRTVALKLIKSEHAFDDTFRKMFLDEARIASKINHVNVVEVLDLGDESGVLFLAMALVEGDSLHDFARMVASEGSSIEPAVAIKIVQDVALGLHAAHDLLGEDGRPLGVVHRDVSPQNILIGIDGRVRITDFGIAKLNGRLAEQTETGTVKGKVAYLSPEQARRIPPDRRSDVFSLAIVLWELLAGKRLFKDDDPIATLENVTSMNVPPLASMGHPVAVSDVVARALSRNPDERYATALEFQRELARAAKESNRTATQEDVASWASSLVLETVEEQRASLRPSPDKPAQTTSDETVGKPSSRRAQGTELDEANASKAVSLANSAQRNRRPWIVGVPLALAGVAGILWLSGRDTERAADTSPDQTKTAASAPKAGRPVDPVRSVFPAATSTADPSSTEPARSATPLRPTATASLTSQTSSIAEPSGTRPRFDNPYAKKGATP